MLAAAVMNALIWAASFERAESLKEDKKKKKNKKKMLIQARWGRRLMRVYVHLPRWSSLHAAAAAAAYGDDQRADAIDLLCLFGLAGFVWPAFSTCEMGAKLDGAAAAMAMKRRRCTWVRPSAARPGKLARAYNGHPPPSRLELGQRWGSLLAEWQRSHPASTLPARQADVFVKFSMAAADAKWTAQSNTLLGIGEQQVAAAPCESTTPPKQATAAVAVANQTKTKS